MNKITMFIFSSLFTVLAFPCGAPSIFENISFEEFNDPVKHAQKAIYEEMFNKNVSKKKENYVIDKENLRKMVKGIVNEVLDERLKEQPECFKKEDK